MSFRKSFDITPWDKDGYSSFGLKRNQAKKLGLVFIIFGILLMSPPIIPCPDDLINIFIAGYLIKAFNVDISSALLFTYTFLAWGIFAFGLYIYPYSTEQLLNGYITKFKKIIYKYIKKPIVLIGLIILSYYVFKWYQSILMSIM